MLCGLAVLLLNFASIAGAQGTPDIDAPISGQIEVYPRRVKLDHRRFPHSVIVTGTTAEGISVDLSPEARLQTGDANVVRVEGRSLHPVKSGQAEVIVTARGQTAKIEAEVDLPAEERHVSFRHEVMPVLSKGGCNMGACHGYSLGKNGFKLSLRGADAAHDFRALSREVFGRRIDRLRPAASLIATKPTGQVPHEGGVRFSRDSHLHDTLIGWVREGATGDVEDPVRVERVEMVPDKLVLTPGSRHRVQLLAHYSDGTIRDVTRLGVYTINNPRFGEMAEDGLIAAGELGETAVVARFERKFATTGLVVLKPRAGFTPTPVPDGLIDRFVIKKLNRLHIRPSPICGDEVYLRRVYLDLIGIQPTPEEVLTFVADNDPNKRVRIVDELFERPEFIDQWSLKWGDLLQNSRLRLSDPAVYAFREWIRGAVASNMPLDQFARRILTGRGGVMDDPTSAYYLVSEDPHDTLQRATQVFCGVRMLCAKCHPHPMENWTQADYYGLYNFFNQVTTKADQRLVGVKNAKAVVINASAGYTANPRTRKAQPPRFLGGTEPEIDAGADRREVYARWLTSPENPHFARSVTNRIWSYFFHRGVIDPVDDLRSTNPPVNPQLLEALTEEFVAHEFDVRHLMRVIVTSQTYQRSSAANDTNRHDESNFSRSVPRRVPAEALLDSLVQATGVPERFSGAPGGFTAKQLPDAEVKSEFLGLFGKPTRAEACECERDDGSNMLQALHMINGQSILGRVSAGNGRVAQLLRQKPSDEELIEQLYLWSLARRPTPEEVDLGLAHIESYGEKRTEAAQDFMWALLNSRQFLMVH